MFNGLSYMFYSFCYFFLQTFFTQLANIYIYIYIYIYIGYPIIFKNELLFPYFCLNIFLHYVLFGFISYNCTLKIIYFVMQTQNVKLQSYSQL